MFCFFREPLEYYTHYLCYILCVHLIYHTIFHSLRYLSIIPSFSHPSSPPSPVTTFVLRVRARGLFHCKLFSELPPLFLSIDLCLVRPVSHRRTDYHLFTVLPITDLTSSSDSVSQPSPVPYTVDSRYPYRDENEPPSPFPYVTAQPSFPFPLQE